MKKHITPVNVARGLFLLVAIASTISLAINTWSFASFLRYFSTSINMVVAVWMLYLFFFLPDMKETKKKTLAMWVLIWVLAYLLIGNGLPFVLWLLQIGFTWAVEKTGLTPITFVALHTLQIVIVPVILYLLLRFEVNAVFQKTKTYNPLVHLGILWAVFLGVVYLVVAAM